MRENVSKIIARFFRFAAVNSLNLNSWFTVHELELPETLKKKS